MVGFSGVVVVMVSGASPKLISENVGMSENDGVISSNPRSKSFGNGISLAVISVTGSVTGTGCAVGASILNADVWIWPMLLRARINALRISAGISSDSSFCGVGASVSCAGVVGSLGVGDGATWGVDHSLEI